jgi:hypothetical protein
MGKYNEQPPKKKDDKGSKRGPQATAANLAGQTLGPAMQIGRRGITQLSDMIGNKDSNKANLKALRMRGLDKGRREFLNAVKSAKDTKPKGRLNLSDLENAMKKADSVKGKDASAKAKEARGLKKGGPVRKSKKSGRLAMRGYGKARK